MSQADFPYPPIPAAPVRRRWPARLAVVLALALALVILAAALAGGLLFGLAGLLADGFGLTINGEPFVFPSHDLHDLPALLAGAGVLVTLLLLLVAVPLLVVAVMVAVVLAVLLVILLAVGLPVAGVALGIGGALFAVLITAALALSPLWLLLLLLWWALRRKPPLAARQGTTMYP